MQNKNMVCSNQCSLCSMKCTGSGAGEGADTVLSVQYAVRSVLPATCEELKFQDLIMYLAKSNINP